jgi:hypothetical protein
MDKTNYTVLSLVAIVAITAIVAIFINAKAPQGLAPLETTIGPTARAVLSVPLTGRVTAEAPREITPEGNRLDLNDDGSLDDDDSAILALVIDRVQFCPRSKRCDVNGDNVVDVHDLAALNARIIETQIASEPDASTTPTRSADALLVAVTGTSA